MISHGSLSWFLVDANTPTPSELVEMTETSWLWLLDAERACSLLVGRCLGGMLAGEPQQMVEQHCENWLNHSLFNNGLDPSVCANSGSLKILVF
jgi:hypothetical protein